MAFEAQISWEFMPRRAPAVDLGQVPLGGFFSLVEQVEGWGLWSFDLPETVRWSPKVYAIYGLDPARYSPTVETLIEHFIPEDRGRFGEAISAAIKGQKGYRFTGRIKRPDGHVRLIESVAEMVSDGQKVVRIYGRDLTEAAEREILASQRQQLFRDIVENMPTPAVVVDHAFTVAACSGTWLDSHGFRNKREVVGKNLYSLVPNTPLDARAEHERVLRGRVVRTKRSLFDPRTRQQVARDGRTHSVAIARRQTRWGSHDDRLEQHILCIISG